ncbi:MAG TPA: hypothetical protein VMV27_08445, partial [Candidatus Binataceae bacterium]|nr:hypothetical protein [Candidatus Binataceae bacterium]
MNPGAQIVRMPPLDDPWRRLPWLIPAAVIAWAALLFGFSMLLQQTAPRAIPENAVEARIIEIPVGGLAGGGGAGPAPAAPVPRVAPKPVPKQVHRKRVKTAPPP